MNSNSTYDHLIQRIESKIVELEIEVNSLPHISFLTFFVVLPQAIFHPSQFDELYYKIHQLRGKVKSALDTYAHTSSGEKNLELSNKEKAIEQSEKNYFSKFMKLLEEIAFLENELNQKNIGSFFNSNNSNHHINFTKTLSKNGEIDWSNLDS